MEPTNLDEIKTALEKAAYGSWVKRLMCAELIDTRSHGWELYTVQFQGKPQNTRLFFDRINGKAWPLAEGNCRNLELAGR